MGVQHQQVQALRALLVVQGAYQHAAGVYAHHFPRGEIGDRHAGLSHQLFRLIVLVYAAQNDPVLARAVVQDELQELLRLRHSLAGLHLHNTEIRTAESLKVHKVPEKRLYFDLGEVYDLRRLGRLLGGLCRLRHVQRLHGGDVNTTRT